MLTIIHGDDTTASRNYYLERKKRATSPITLDSDTITITEIMQILSGSGLFGEEKDIFIESLITKKKKSAELTAMLTAFLSQKDASVYLWEGKLVDGRTLTSLKTARSEIFKLPQSLFAFLDALTPGNPRLIPLFHTTIETVEIELLFFMLVRQLRILLTLSSTPGEIGVIDEVKRLAPWQRTKLQKQALQFPSEVLLTSYVKLAEIDLAAKTGKLTMPLESVIDIWLIDLYTVIESRRV